MPPVAVTEFQDALGELAARSGEATDKLLSRVGRLSPAEARAFITDAYPALLDPFLKASGELTAQWYSEQPVAVKSPGASVFVPEPVVLATGEQLAISGRWALTQPNAKTAILGSATRQVMNASRDTVIVNAQREGVRWVREAKPDACGFCRMLATRAAIPVSRSGRITSYKSEGVFKDQKTGQYYLGVIGKRGVIRSGKQRGDKYHDHCRCIAVPLRDGRYNPPEYVQKWTDEYETLFDQYGSDPIQISRLMDAGRQRPDRLKPLVTVAASAPTIAEPVNLDQPTIASPAQVDRNNLDSATTVDEAATYIKDKYGVDVARLINSPMANGVPIQESITRGVDALSAAQAAKPHFISADTAKEFCQAVDDMLEKYPFLTLDEIKADFYPAGNPLGASAYASRKLDGGKTIGAKSVTVTGFADAQGETVGAAYRRYQKWLETDAADERYKSESIKRPVYAVIIHEMGHVMDYASGGLASTRVGQALRDYISNLPEAQAIKDLPAVKRIVGDEFTFSTQYQDFEKQWLRDNLVSAYSFKASDRASGALNLVEAMAEAFADVELRGDGAEIASQIIHRAMVDAAREYTGSK